MNKNSIRDTYIDIVKGIGIISIVIGHSGWVLPIGKGVNIGTFVYSYHIMLFLFVAGYCFKNIYSADPYSYIGKRIKSICPLYVKYNIVFVLLHNILRRIHIIDSEQKIYTVNEIISKILSSFALVTSEGMLGAFWFLPMYLFAICIFCILFSWAERTNRKNVVHGVIIILSGLAGIYINWNQMYLNYHIQTSILAIPLIYIGYFCKLKWEWIYNYLSVVVGILCAAVIYWIMSLDIGIVELTVNSIINPYLFFPVTLMGIYFCLSLAKVLNHFTITRKIFSLVGKNSFHIMALHFLGIKIVDLIYGNIINAEPSVIEGYPHGFNLWFVYWIFGILIPLFLVISIRKIRFVIIKDDSSK